MAGVITHMVIAKEMLQYLPIGTIKDESMFYLGAIAPDAVHAREGYVRAHKKHSHFRDDIPDRDFEIPENYAHYQKRLVEFMNANKERKDGLLDLYRGYIVHILTDEFFVLSIRKEFCEAMEKLGIDQHDRPFFDYIVTDMNRNDMQLVYNYEGIQELRKDMEHAEAHPIDNFITAQELNDCRDWLIYQHFILQQEQLQPVFISCDRMLEFIHTAAEQIVRMMSEGESLPKML